MVANFEILNLPPLSQQEIELLIKQTLGEIPSKEVIQKITQESGGNPFVLMESLRWYVEKYPQRSLQDVISEMPLSSSVNHLLRTRLIGMDPFHREILNTAAVIGNQFTIDLIAETNECTHPAAADAFDQLEKERLIKTVTKFDPIGGYTFSHPRLRSILLNDMSDARKQYKHLQIAHYLERFRGQRHARAAILAQHFEAGGDVLKAFEYWLQTAEYALLMTSNNESLAALQSANNLILHQIVLFSDEQICSLYSRYADLLSNLDSLDSLEKIAAFLINVGEQRKNHLLLGCGLSYRADCERRRRYLPQALQTGLRAIQHLKLTKDIRLLARASYYTGLIYNALDQFKESLEINESTQQLLETALHTQPGDLNLNRELGYIEYALSILAFYNGAVQKSHSLIGKAAERMEMGFDFRGLANCRILLIENQSQLGNYQESLSACQQSLPIINMLQKDLLSIWYFNAAAQVHLSIGHLDECWDALEKSSTLCEKRQVKDPLVRVHTLRSLIFHALGNYARALDESRIAISIPSGKYMQLNAHGQHARALTAVGDLEEARYQTEHLLKASSEYEFWGVNLVAECLKAQIFSLQNENDKARALLEDISEKAKRRSLKEVLMDIYLLYGEVVLKQGEISVAQRLLLSLLANERASLTPWNELKLLTLLQRTKLQSGVTNDTLGQRALEILETLRFNSTHPQLKSDFDHYFNTNVHLF